MKFYINPTIIPTKTALEIFRAFSPTIPKKRLKIPKIFNLKYCSYCCKNSVTDYFVYTKK